MYISQTAQRFQHLIKIQRKYIGPILTDFILPGQVDFVEIVPFKKSEAVDTGKRTINAQMILEWAASLIHVKTEAFDLLLTSVGVAVVSWLQ